MRTFKMICFLVMLLVHPVFLVFPGEVIVVQNTIQEINACKGKLIINRVRTWGGAKEEDENKYFNTPVAVLIDSSNTVYISDRLNHQIKVFDKKGNFLRSIGVRGKGPGDLYGPASIAFSPYGDLWVEEQAGRRIQCFSPQGKSKSIFNVVGMSSWMEVTLENKIALYLPQRTYETNKIIVLYDEKGKLVRDLGFCDFKTSHPYLGEKYKICIDRDGHFLVVNSGTPLIRKYSSSGRLERAITFETPFNLSTKIQINKNGDDVIRTNFETKNKADVSNKNSGITIQISNESKKSQLLYGLCCAVGTDKKNNIYIVSLHRFLTEKELKGTMVSGNFDKINRSYLNYDIVEQTDIYYLLVFNPNGKIISTVPLEVFCDNIYIKDDRFFIIDGHYNQRVLEYQMVFKE